MTAHKLKIITIILPILLVLLAVNSCKTGDPLDRTSETQGTKITTSESIDTGHRIGQRPRNFNLPNTAGGTTKLNDLRGKPILLNFWATWCSPCRLEMPELQILHEKLKDKLVIVAVNLDGTKEEILAYKESMGLTFPTVIDVNKEVWESFSPIGLPSSYLLDVDGVIRAVKIGPFISLEDMNRSLAVIGITV